MTRDRSCEAVMIIVMVSLGEKVGVGCLNDQRYRDISSPTRLYTHLSYKYEGS